MLLSAIPSELIELNITKTCNTFGSECDLKIHVQILNIPSAINRGPKTAYFRRFSTTAQLDGKFNDEYRRKQT